MGKALQIRQEAADSPRGLTARRWPALLALAPNLAKPEHKALSDEVERLFATAGAMK